MNKRNYFVVLACMVAIATMATGVLGGMTPLMGQIQLEQSTLIPIANGAIQLIGGTFNFSIWRNTGGGLLIFFHDRIPVDNHAAIFRLMGSDGKKWTIMDTKISDIWVTILATSVYDRDFAEVSGNKRGPFAQEERAAKVVMDKLRGIGKITYLDLFH
jgi:hypothetical protein